METNEVKLHSSAAYIELLTIQLNGEDPEYYEVNSTTNILTLNFSEPLIVENDYVLEITFNARLLSSGKFLL